VHLQGVASWRGSPGHHTASSNLRPLCPNHRAPDAAPLPESLGHRTPTFMHAPRWASLAAALCPATLRAQATMPTCYFVLRHPRERPPWSSHSHILTHCERPHRPFPSPVRTVVAHIYITCHHPCAWQDLVAARTLSLLAGPSKNLTVERCHCKRLNDRLSMFCHVMPKISKVGRNQI
jgi:hypothetical protein